MSQVTYIDRDPSTGEVISRSTYEADSSRRTTIGAGGRVSKTIRTIDSSGRIIIAGKSSLQVAEELKALETQRARDRAVEEADRFESERIAELDKRSSREKYEAIIRASKEMTPLASDYVDSKVVRLVDKGGDRLKSKGYRKVVEVGHPSFSEKETTVKFLPPPDVEAKKTYMATEDAGLKPPSSNYFEKSFGTFKQGFSLEPDPSGRDPRTYSGPESIGFGLGLATGIATSGVAGYEFLGAKASKVVYKSPKLFSLLEKGSVIASTKVGKGLLIAGGGLYVAGEGVDIYRGYEDGGVIGASREAFKVTRDIALFGGVGAGFKAETIKEVAGSKFVFLGDAETVTKVGVGDSFKSVVKTKGELTEFSKAGKIRRSFFVDDVSEVGGLSRQISKTSKPFKLGSFVGEETVVSAEVEALLGTTSKIQKTGRVFGKRVSVVADKPVSSRLLKERTGLVSEVSISSDVRGVQDTSTIKTVELISGKKSFVEGFGSGKFTGKSGKDVRVSGVKGSEVSRSVDDSVSKFRFSSVSEEGVGVVSKFEGRALESSFDSSGKVLTSKINYVDTVINPKVGGLGLDITVPGISESVSKSVVSGVVAKVSPKVIGISSVIKPGPVVVKSEGFGVVSSVVGDIVKPVGASARPSTVSGPGEKVSSVKSVFAGGVAYDEEVIISELDKSGGISRPVRADVLVKGMDMGVKSALVVSSVSKKAQRDVKSVISGSKSKISVDVSKKLASESGLIKVPKIVIDSVSKSSQIVGPRVSLISKSGVRSVAPPKINVIPGLGGLPVVVPSRLPKRAGLGGGFKVFVKKRGKFEGASTKVFTRESAKRFGRFKVGTSASATFKIVKASGSPIKYSGPSYAPGSFYSKVEDVFVEKREKRIKSSGELKEITYKGIASSKRKKKSRKGGGKKWEIF